MKTTHTACTGEALRVSVVLAQSPPSTRPLQPHGRGYICLLRPDVDQTQRTLINVPPKITAA